MSKIKWFMKQYWRITAIRAWMGLALAMFSLGKVYSEQIPSLNALGLIGALILGSVLVLIFLGIGWLYDVKARMWSPMNQASIERDPYRYIPNYKTYAIDYPAIYAILDVMQQVLSKRGISSGALNDAKSYLHRYFNRSPEREDIVDAQEDCNRFFEDNPFLGSTGKRKKVGLKGKAKLEFEVTKLRLSWIQDLTGLFQDALVFAAVYVVWIFPGVATNGVVPIGFLIIGFFLLSIPMLFVVTSIGWYYDKKLRVWSPDMIVKVERTPYTFVAYPRDYAIDLPAQYAILEVLREVLLKLKIDASELDSILSYLFDYFDLKASREKDMQKARIMRREYGQVFVKRMDENED